MWGGQQLRDASETLNACARVSWGHAHSYIPCQALSIPSFPQLLSSVYTFRLNRDSDYNEVRLEVHWSLPGAGLFKMASAFFVHMSITSMHADGSGFVARWAPDNGKPPLSLTSLLLMFSALCLPQSVLYRNLKLCTA